MSRVGEPSVLFDTSAVIGLIERRSPTLMAIAKELGGPFTRSITVHGELRHGAAVVARPGQPERVRTFEKYAQLSEWSDLEVGLDDVGEVYGDVSAIASEHGVALGMNDRWIIAECITQRASLVTGDRGQARLTELVVARRDEKFDVVLAV